MEKNFNQFLIANDALNADKQTKDALRTQYRKLYFKRQKQLTKHKKKRVEIIFLKLEYLELEKHAEFLGISIADYTRKAIVATMNDCYIISSKEVLEDVTIAIKGVHGQLSQIAHVALHKGHVSGDDMQRARDMLIELENKLIGSLEPKALDKWIAEQVTKNSDFLRQLESSIDGYKNDLPCS